MGTSNFLSLCVYVVDFVGSIKKVEFIALPKRRGKGKVEGGGTGGRKRGEGRGMVEVVAGREKEEEEMF